MDLMDLTKFGINIVLRPDTNISMISGSAIQKGLRTVNRDGDTDRFVIGSSKYRVDSTKKSEEGTFGKVYRVIGEDNTQYAIKVIIPEYFDLLINECILNIVIVEASKHEINGPYAPTFYKIGYNSKHNEAYILTEYMTNTLHKLVSSHNIDLNDIAITEALKQISSALLFLGKRLQFNHRDLKPDNIMYNITADGKYVFKLIDFGYSCLTWKGLKISGNDDFNFCYKKDRDLSQLLYVLCTHYGYMMSESLEERMYEILTATVGKDKHKTCKLLGNCGEKEGLRDWGNSYDFFNRANVNVPSASIYSMKKHIQNYINRKPFQKSINVKNLQSSANTFARNITHLPIQTHLKKDPKRLYRNTQKLNLRLIPNLTRKNRK